MRHRGKGTLTRKNQAHPLQRSLVAAPCSLALSPSLRSTSTVLKARPKSAPARDLSSADSAPPPIPPRLAAPALPSVSRPTVPVSARLSARSDGSLPQQRIGGGRWPACIHSTVRTGGSIVCCGRRAIHHDPFPLRLLLVAAVAVRRSVRRCRVVFVAALPHLAAARTIRGGGTRCRAHIEGGSYQW